MNRGSDIDLTGLPHARMILIGPDGVLAEQDESGRAHALLGADVEEINRELRLRGMHAEPDGPISTQVTGFSRYALAALTALPTVRLVVAVAGDDTAVRGYLAILAADDLRAVERDLRLINALAG